MVRLIVSENHPRLLIVIHLSCLLLWSAVTAIRRGKMSLGGKKAY